jgi:hypothetical protein
MDQTPPEPESPSPAGRGWGGSRDDEGVGEPERPETSSADRTVQDGSVAPAAGERSGSADFPRHGQATVEGQVQNFHEGVEAGRPVTVWTFRIKRYDRSGNELPALPALMRTAYVEGSISDGDRVRVTGEWKDGTLHVDRVDDITTQAVVKRKGGCLGWVGAIFLIGAIIAPRPNRPRRAPADHRR